MVDRLFPLALFGGKMGVGAAGRLIDRQDTPGEAPSKWPPSGRRSLGSFVICRATKKVGRSPIQIVAL